MRPQRINTYCFCSSLAALLLIFAATFQTACTRTYSNTDEEMAMKDTVVNMYNLYVNGFFLEYVAMMESLDGKPQEYKQQMADLMKQRHRAQQEEHGGLTSCRVQRIDRLNENYCDAYVEITFSDNTTDDILLPMVKVAGTWRIK